MSWNVCHVGDMEGGSMAMAGRRWVWDLYVVIGVGGYG